MRRVAIWGPSSAMPKFFLNATNAMDKRWKVVGICRQNQNAIVCRRKARAACATPEPLLPCHSSRKSMPFSFAAGMFYVIDAARAVGTVGQHVMAEKSMFAPLSCLPHPVMVQPQPRRIGNAHRCRRHATTHTYCRRVRGRQAVLAKVMARRDA